MLVPQERLVAIRRGFSFMFPFQVVLTANRVVEVVKGRKELSTVIMGTMGLTLKLGEDFTTAGFRLEIIGTFFLYTFFPFPF